MGILNDDFDMFMDQLILYIVLLEKVVEVGSGVSRLTTSGAGGGPFFYDIEQFTVVLVGIFQYLLCFEVEWYPTTLFVQVFK
jgi:hypothetical protein